MELTLYYHPRSRAARVRWLLEELAVPYRLVRVDLQAGEQRQPAYRAIHPLGLVPALTDGPLRLIESGAICAYLADRYGLGRLAPPLDSPLRGPYQQWLWFLACTLEPPVLAFIERSDAAARAAFDRVAEVLADGLGAGPYLLGEGFSAADVVVGSVLGWAKGAGLLEGGGQAHERLRAYGRLVGGREAARRARAD